jgi:Cu/Ag efflux protein CusF
MVFKRSVGLMVVSASLALSPAAFADDKPLPSKTVVATTSIKATVTGLDLPGRVITLKGPKGNSVTFHVGDEVKNLDQIKVGDVVVAKYYESIAVRVTKPGAPAAEAVDAVATAKPGEMPAGAAIKQESIKAKITAIGKHKESVTLLGPEGNSVTIKVKNPKNLDGVKVGDDVEITYTQALAVAVEKAAAPKKK